MLPPVTIGYMTVAGRFFALISWSKNEEPLITAEARIRTGARYDRERFSFVADLSLKNGRAAAHIIAFASPVRTTKFADETDCGFI